jgi:predicted PurR-regulated permease PerM
LIPPPGEMTKNWPAFAKPIIDLWNLASTNLQGLTMQFKDQIEVAGNWLFTELAGIGKNILQFLASIFLAGVFLVYSEPISKSIVKIFKKVAGKNGEKFATLSVVTVRNVFKSVIGVAFIQATLASIGFFIAGVPYAGLWTILCLITGIIQLGVWIIVIPISVYMFMATGTLTAILFAVWIIFVALSDNFIKPILMGRGAPVPMMVIFLGSIGGFIYTGFIGLFMGAIVLSIGYKLFMAWVETEN